MKDRRRDLPGGRCAYTSRMRTTTSAIKRYFMNCPRCGGYRIRRSEWRVALGAIIGILLIITGLVYYGLLSYNIPDVMNRHLSLTKPRNAAFEPVGWVVRFTVCILFSAGFFKLLTGACQVNGSGS